MKRYFLFVHIYVNIKNFYKIKEFPNDRDSYGIHGGFSENLIGTNISENKLDQKSISPENENNINLIASKTSKYKQLDTIEEQKEYDNPRNVMDLMENNEAKKENENPRNVIDLMENKELLNSEFL